ncbi:MAG: dTDP-4-dehydrorhamnose 3,5-epimerase family protein [Acidobacteriota bacterium]|nr:MAG: dTDP-4-dehydrorhamnose 3,5-epimerase family protein [Acidobacteriota bacterium]
MIEGVCVDRLEPRVDERGRLVELFRRDDPATRDYGQIHVTTLYPGVVKAWHRHRRRADVIAVVAGMARLGLYDERQGSATEGELNQFFLGVHAPMRITIPPGVWFGFKGMGTDEAVIVVLTSQPFDPRDPDEDRLDPLVNEIPFDWDRRDR